MDLFIKCAMAVAVMVIVHYLSKTDHYYITGLALSFPGLSIIAYYFMYVEQGAAKVHTSTYFAMLSSVCFVIFLLALNLSIKKYNIHASILIASVAWVAVSSLLVVMWNRPLQP